MTIMAPPPIALMRPSVGRLNGVVAALETGWSSDGLQNSDRTKAELACIATNPATYIAMLDNRGARHSPVRLPDGSIIPRLPGYHLWIWDGTYCGNISIRWQPDTAALPPTCLGHIGYAVVPWKRNRGYATTALRLMLKNASAQQLPYAEITTDPDNIASRKVIERNGGRFIEVFAKPTALGGTPCLRYRICL